MTHIVPLALWAVLALGKVWDTFRRRHGVLTDPQRERRRDAPESQPKDVATPKDKGDDE